MKSSVGGAWRARTAETEEAEGGRGWSGGHRGPCLPCSRPWDSSRPLLLPAVSRKSSSPRPSQRCRKPVLAGRGKERGSDSTATGPSRCFAAVLGDSKEWGRGQEFDLIRDEGFLFHIFSDSTSSASWLGSLPRLPPAPSGKVDRATGCSLKVTIFVQNQRY